MAELLVSSGAACLKPLQKKKKAIFTRWTLLCFVASNVAKHPPLKKKNIFKRQGQESEFQSFAALIPPLLKIVISSSDTCCCGSCPSTKTPASLPETAPLMKNNSAGTCHSSPAAWMAVLKVTTLGVTLKVPALKKSASVGGVRELQLAVH